MIGTLLSVAMFIVGIIYLGSFILSLATFGASTIVGILVLAVGIWFLIQPSLIVSLVPVILGVGLVFHGIRAVTEAVNAKKYGYEKWGMDLVFAIICLVCGLVCVLSAWSIETVYYAGRNRADYQRSAESVDCCHSNACSEGLQTAHRDC